MGQVLRTWLHLGHVFGGNEKLFQMAPLAHRGSTVIVTPVPDGSTGGLESTQLGPFCAEILKPTQPKSLLVDSIQEVAVPAISMCALKITDVLDFVACLSLGS